MLLEAKSENCFSSRFVLKVDGRPVGRFHGRWFSESLDIDLTERRHLQFRKLDWIGSKFELVDPLHNQILGSCNPSGFFSSGWDLNLSAGPGRLERVGWLNSAYEFKQEAEVHARVDRLGWCDRGWVVDGNDAMTQEDLLLIGLVYLVIQNRQATTTASAT
jgi:hypothetical protein